MQRTVSATEARVRFGELMRRVVDERTAIVVERGGKPLVVVLPVEEYERLCAGQPEQEDWWERVERARAEVARSLNGRPLPNIEDLIHEMREERDAQILGNLLGREPGGSSGRHPDRSAGGRAVETVEG